MSYLELYDSSRVELAQPEQVYDFAGSKEEEVAEAPPVQAKFMQQGLTDDIAQNILDTLDAVQAMNLSHNNLTIFPERASRNLIALDLSYNQIHVPIVLSATLFLIELNLSNNDITNLRGLSVLTTVVFLDLSENQISHIDGLENMKNLCTLNVKFNRLSTFQSLRLLSYNCSLRNIALEGNPIEEDNYFKVKLLNCVPNLKTLDGATVWRRTALQSTIVNDDLKYSDLCQRTPQVVDKYAQLSRRSNSQMMNESVLNNFSASMITMRSLFLSTNRSPNKSHTDNTSMNITSMSHPKQSNTPSSSTSTRSDKAGKRENSVDLIHGNDQTSGKMKMNGSGSASASLPGKDFEKLGLVSSSLKQQQQPNSPSRDHQRLDRVTLADVSLLPIHLQKTLSNLRGSPKKTNRSHTDQSPSFTASDFRDQKSEPDRSRSTLPWRRPPSIAPNLDIRFQNSRNKRADPDAYQSKSQTSKQRVHGPESVVTNNFREKPQLTNPRNSHDTEPVAQPSSRRRSASPLQSKSPHSPSPRRNHSPQESSSLTQIITKEWMHPALKAEPPTGGTLGPPPRRFDSEVMELTNTSSLLVLQNSFDVDRRTVGRGSRSLATGGSHSTDTRGRSKSRDASPSNNRRRGSSTGGRSVTSADRTLTAASPSLSGRRSVSQTRSSMGRTSFTAKVLQYRDEAERQDRELAEARTFSRPTSPSPFKRNSAYTILQGTTSPTVLSDNYSTVYSYSSSKVQAFSPTNATPSRKNTASFSSKSSLPGSTTSHVRLTSTERILQQYETQPDRHSSDSVILELPFPPRPKVSASPKLKQHNSYTRSGDETQANQGYTYSSSNETKEDSPLDQKIHVSTPPRSSPQLKSEEPGDHDESPYRRFVRLRQRLSNKYMPSGRNDDFREEQNQISPHPHQNGFNTASVSHSRSVPNDYNLSNKHGHLYDYARHISVEKVDSMLHSSVENLPAVREITAVETKILDLQEQEMQFIKLKEQYQRQFQEQYEAQRRKDDSTLLVVPQSTTTLMEGSGNGSNMSDTMGPVAKNLRDNAVGLPPPPPPTNSYDMLNELIQRRRNILEHIAQPPGHMTDISNSEVNDASRVPNGKVILSAIGELKQRQTTSVNMLSTVGREAGERRDERETLERVVVPAAVSVVPSSISNYLNMAIPSPMLGTAGGSTGGISQQQVGNSFLSRFTSCNPHVMNGDSSSSLPMPNPCDMSPLVPYQPVPYNAKPQLDLPTHLESKLLSEQQKQQNRPSRSRSPSPTNRSRKNSFKSSLTSTQDTTTENLDKAIRMLQHKQSHDIRRLQNH